MRSQFGFSPYARVEPPNEDDNGKWDNSMVLERNEAGPEFNPYVYFSDVYEHAPWCRRSCGMVCNPTNVKHSEIKPYRHDPCCRGGCANLCEEHAQLQ